MKNFTKSLVGIYLIINLISCQDETISSLEVINTTKNTMSTSDLNELKQFIGEPFYIRKTGQNSEDYSYLSYDPNVYQSSGSGRGRTWNTLRLENLKNSDQQWIFEESIKNGKSYFRIKNYTTGKYIDSKDNKPVLNANLVYGNQYTTSTSIGFEYIPESDLYMIGEYYPAGSVVVDLTFAGWLHSDNSYNGNLSYTKTKNTSRQTWQLISCEDYEILEYSFTIANGLDKIQSIPKVWTSTVRNDNNEDIPSRSYQIKYSTTSTSTFSTTTGVKISKKISANAKLGVPRIIKKLTPGGDLELSLGTEITREDSYTYQEGKTDSKSIDITESITFKQRAGQTVKIETTSFEYQTKATYRVKIRGLSSGKIHYLTGKWNGVIVSDTYIKVSDITNGNVVAEKTIIR